MGKLKNQIKRIAELSEKERFYGRTTQDQILSLMEEAGELSRAIQVEDGTKKSEIVESSTVEAIDTVICALAIYFSRGGEVKDLLDIMHRKLSKWEAKLEQ